MLEHMAWLLTLIVSVLTATAAHKRIWATDDIPHWDMLVFSIAVAVCIVSVLALAGLT